MYTSAVFSVLDPISGDAIYPSRPPRPLAVGSCRKWNAQEVEFARYVITRDL